MYGPEWFPEWVTKFVEIEADAREVVHEFMRLLMAQVNTQQAQRMPNKAFQTDAGEAAISIGSVDRTLETEADGVS